MLSYDETMKRLEDMRPRFADGFSSSDRIFLEEYHQLFFGKKITRTGCSDCYRDAYLLIYNKLKRERTMPQLSEYRIRPGEVLHFFGESKYYTLDVSSEIAERFLKQNNANISKFDRFPEDWQTRIAEPKVEEATVEPKTEEETPAEEVKASKKRTSRK